MPRSHEDGGDDSHGFYRFRNQEIVRVNYHVQVDKETYKNILPNGDYHTATQSPDERDAWIQEWGTGLITPAIQNI